MSEGKLKIAVLGLDEGSKVLLEALDQNDYFEIQAVADKDTNLVESVAGKCQCAAYDDYRQLIIEMDSRAGVNDINCMLVAAGIHSCDEYVRMG